MVRLVLAVAVWGLPGCDAADEPRYSSDENAVSHQPGEADLRRELEEAERNRTHNAQ
jgi:hypothetical protein